MKTGAAYPGLNKFGDEGGETSKGNAIYFIESDVHAPYDWFAPKIASGLTQAGISQTKQSN